MAAPVLDEDETAVRQVERLGFSAADVQHVLVTHLDVDHCGGLPGFPHATVHVHTGVACYHRELDSEPEPHPVPDIVQTRAEVTLFSAHDPWEFGRLAS